MPILKFTFDHSVNVSAQEGDILYFCNTTHNQADNDQKTIGIRLAKQPDKDKENWTLATNKDGYFKGFLPEENQLDNDGTDTKRGIDKLSIIRFYLNFNSR